MTKPKCFHTCCRLDLFFFLMKRLAHCDRFVTTCPKFEKSVGSAIWREQQHDFTTANRRCTIQPDSEKSHLFFGLLCGSRLLQYYMEMFWEVRWHFVSDCGENSRHCCAEIFASTMAVRLYISVVLLKGLSMNIILFSLCYGSGLIYVN